MPPISPEKIQELAKKVPVKAIGKGLKLGGEQLQKIVKRYGLRLLLLGVPFMETDQAHPESVEVAPHNRADQVFSRYVRSAKADLKSSLGTKPLNPSQKAIFDRAVAYPEDELMAVALKESHLDPRKENGGYFQLTNIAIEELKLAFPTYNLGSALSPEKNVELGMLYLALIQERYLVQHPQGVKMSEVDQRAVTRFFYNMGPTAGKRILEETEAQSAEEFGAGVVNMVGNKMSLLNSVGIDFVGPSAEEEVTDEVYKVPYMRSGAEGIYLKHSKGEKSGYEDELEEPLFKGQDYPTVQKTLISLRYFRLTQAIVDTLQNPETREAYLEQMFGQEGGAQLVFHDVSRTVQKGDTLYKLSEELGVSVAYLQKKNGLSSTDIKAGQTLQVPLLSGQVKPYLYEVQLGSKKRPWVAATTKGFYSSLVANEEYRAYLNEVVPIEPDDIEEGIFMFNKTFNPEFAQVADARSIPAGAWIWVPNVNYFRDYFKDTVGEGKADPDPIRDEAPPTQSFTSGKLNTLASGQYVKKQGSKWVLDLDESQEGALSFPARAWGDHPAWHVAGDLKRKRFGGEDGLVDVRKVVLHSTISEDAHATIRRELAHFAVERDGAIQYIVSVNKDGDSRFQIPPHAGKSCWDGMQDLNRYAIGIEVVAKAGQDWSSAQFEAVEDLVYWIGGYYGLQKNDIVTHKQIAADGRYGRGRKSDPYSSNTARFWSNLNLPNNSELLDLCVARGSTPANVSAINADSNHTDVWPGLMAAETNF